MAKLVYSPKEAASHLGRSEEVVRRWCRAGKLGTQAEGGSGWIIRRYELERLLGEDTGRALGGE